jgi:hypothetical protein
MELVGLAVEEAVEAVEAAGERPLVGTDRRPSTRPSGEVPLADHEGRVALVVQHLGDRRGVVGDVAELVGEPGVEVRDRPHADRVVGSTGEQRRPGRRAQRGHVEVGEPQTARRERVDVRRVDVGAEAAELREAGVVEQHDDDVRGVVAGVRLLLEPRLGLGDRTSDTSLERDTVGATTHGRKDMEGRPMNGDQAMRAHSATLPAPNFADPAWVEPPALSDATVAIVTSAALYPVGDEAFTAADTSYRFIDRRPTRPRARPLEPELRPCRRGTRSERRLPDRPTGGARRTGRHRGRRPTTRVVRRQPARRRRHDPPRQRPSVPLQNCAPTASTSSSSRPFDRSARAP